MGESGRTDERVGVGDLYKLTGKTELWYTMSIKRKEETETHDDDICG